MKLPKSSPFKKKQRDPAKNPNKTINHPLKGEELEKPGYRIAKCCGSCYFSVGAGPASGRLMCTYPDSPLYIRRRQREENIDINKKEGLLACPPVHSATVCNNYTLARHKMKNIQRYTAAKLEEEIDDVFE